MKIAVLAVLALGMMACSKEEAPAAAGAAKATPEANANAKPADAKAADKPADAKPAEAPKAAGEFKGLDGKPIVGYLKDPKDDGVCVVLTAKDKADAETLTKDKVAEIAKMMNAEVTDTCKTEGIVGACFAMGMLENYYGPKYTKETAKAACDKDRGKWSE